MAKHDRVLPSDEQISSALMSYTERSVNVEHMWKNIEEKLDEKPRRRWQPWLTLGTAAAVLFMIVLLNWNPISPPPEPFLSEEPQIMRFAAFEPLSGAAEVVGGELRIALTAHQDLELGSGPAVVEIYEQDTLNMVASAATEELSDTRLLAGETAEIHLEIALPEKAGSYQVRLELELDSTEVPEEVSVIVPLIIE